MTAKWLAQVQHLEANPLGLVRDEIVRSAIRLGIFPFVEVRDDHHESGEVLVVGDLSGVRDGSPIKTVANGS